MSWEFALPRALTGAALLKGDAALAIGPSHG